MSQIFHEDSFLMRGLSRFTDLVILNILWVLCSLPVVTIGAAATAVYDVLMRQAEGREPAVVKAFFRSFRVNFRQSTALWLILLVVGGVAAVDLYVGFFTDLAWDGPVRIVVMGFSVLLALVWLMVLSWVFVLQGHFDNPVGTTLKNALLVGVLNIPSTLLFALSTAACLWLTLSFPAAFPFWMFLGYALVAFLLTKRYLPIVKKLEPTQEQQ